MTIDPRERELFAQFLGVAVVGLDVDGAFEEECFVETVQLVLNRLCPSPGYMRLLKESVLQIWKARKAAVREELATAERGSRASSSANSPSSLAFGTLTARQPGRQW